MPRLFPLLFLVAFVVVQLTVGRSGPCGGGACLVPSLAAGLAEGPASCCCEPHHCDGFATEESGSCPQCTLDAQEEAVRYFSIPVLESSDGSGESEPVALVPAEVVCPRDLLTATDILAPPARDRGREFGVWLL